MDLDDFFSDPVAQCSKCGRKTWVPGMVGRTCYMTQPPGSSELTCSGVFRMTPDEIRRIQTKMNQAHRD